MFDDTRSTLLFLVSVLIGMLVGIASGSFCLYFAAFVVFHLFFSGLVSINDQAKKMVASLKNIETDIAEIKKKPSNKQDPLLYNKEGKLAEQPEDLGQQTDITA